jgi:hypothetical protein
MDLQQRINAFVKLGKFLSQFSSEGFEKKDHIEHNDLFFDGFKHQVKLAQEHNGWFSKENVLFSLNGWSNQLTDKNINKWIEKHNFDTENLKTIAIIMAGNDKQLLPFLAKYLEYIEPKFKGRISFTEGRIENYDAVIATGSNNTARYFEYYFKDKPSVIRKNRNSLAILTGKESDDELIALSEDIFRYYGLGCRNVSKLFVPKDYDFQKFFKAMYHWNPIIHENKYANNYDYNKAVYLMSQFEMLENGFLMIKEDESLSSPIATMFYEYYETEETLKATLKDKSDAIQCVVSSGFLDNEIKFGQTQLPNLWDYADNVDTIAFSLTIC